ncbi:alpha/beta hydrolase [Myxococcota bacterium]|nr:alpha/beta hydrolase [Myxococcota bacterium]
MPYQKVRGIEMYYEWHGPKDGDVVVFVNGLFADTTSWSLQRDAFAASYRVLLYDARGQGRSQKPNGPYFHHDHVADLVALLEALAVSEALFVGISHGGTVSMRMAAEHPACVRGLAVANTFAHCDTLMRAKLSSWLCALEWGGPAGRFDISLPWVWGRRFAAEQWSLVEHLRELAAEAEPDAIRALIEGGLNYDIRPLLPKIQAPTLVIAAEEDVLTPPFLARELVAAIPRAVFASIPDAGHAVNFESPHTYNRLILDFLSRIT